MLHDSSANVHADAASYILFAFEFNFVEYILTYVVCYYYFFVEMLLNRQVNVLLTTITTLSINNFMECV